MATTRNTISTDDLSTFGARLRHAREEQRMSRPDLSRQTNKALTVRVIGHLEDGITDPTIRRLHILAEALGVDEGWLQYGENDNKGDIPEKSTPSTQSTRGAHSQPANDLGDDLGDENSTGNGTGNTDGSPKKPVQTGLDRSETLEPTSRDQPELVDTSHTDSTNGTGENIQAGSVEPIEPVEPLPPVSIAPERKHFVEMQGILSDIDLLREQGLQNHPRKMPKLLQRAKEVGEFLEFSDIEELAFDSDVELSGITQDDVDENAMDELVLRLIDTAVLGLDLYRVEVDVLKIFADKNDIEQPFFRSKWQEHKNIVPDVRDAYWQRALEGSIAVTTSLSQS